MKKIKKLAALILVILLLSHNLTAVTDEEFASNLDYYKSLCAGKISADNREVCYEYQQYVNEQIKAQKQSIDDISSQLSTLSDDIDAQGQILQQQIDAIKDAEDKIADLEATIATIQENIAAIEADIQVRKDKINALNEEIKRRVSAQQVTLHQNSMLDFVFGTSSFTDMVRRMFVVNEITKHDQGQIDEFTEQKRLLEKDQADAEREKALQEETLKVNQDLKDTALAAKAEAEQRIADFRSKEAELIAQQEQAMAAQKASEAEMESIRSAINTYINSQNQSDDGTVISPNGFSGTGSNWIYPVSSFYVSAGAWYYPASFGGGIHYGVDMANDVGTPVVSTGPGVVVKASGGCSTYGYLGNSCGNYAGNYVVTIVSMNDKLYGLMYAHLSEIYVGQGQIVQQGTVLGTIGSSGNSTGPHLHHEVTYLGDMSIQEYLESWNGAITFTPSGEYMRMNWRCEVTGAPPCRENPQHWYGLSVGSWY